MAITIDIEKLREEIKIDEENLVEKQAVLRYLEKCENVTQHLSKPEPPHTNATSFKLNAETASIELNQLVPNKKPGTFELEVKDVIESFGNQEFSMEHIDAALTRKGIANNIKHRRSNITSKLGKLEKKNFIERTFQGSGNIQNRYKRVQERAVLQQEKEYEEVHI